MPSLKDQLATLPTTTIEVLSNATSQEKGLEALFLEQGFAGAITTPDGILPPDCGCMGCAGNFCCTDDTH